MAATTPATPEVRSFVTQPITALPKVERAVGTFDEASANALLAALTATLNDDAGKPVIATASDGTSYKDAKAARAEASKANRLLRHVMPQGKNGKTRVYKVGDAFYWAIWLVDAKPATATTNGASA